MKKTFLILVKKPEVIQPLAEVLAPLGARVHNLEKGIIMVANVDRKDSKKVSGFLKNLEILFG
jgi:hypothetical protein